MNSIHVQFNAVGRDLICLVTGGEAHIGATSTGYFVDDKIEIHTHGVPHHREKDLTEQFTQVLVQKFQCTCVCIMGVHYDNLTPEELQKVIAEIKNKFQIALQKNETILKTDRNS